jgi:hypothetical protein
VQQSDRRGGRGAAGAPAGRRSGRPGNKSPGVGVVQGVPGRTASSLAGRAGGAGEGSHGSTGVQASLSSWPATGGAEVGSQCSSAPPFITSQGHRGVTCATCCKAPPTPDLRLCILWRPWGEISACHTLAIGWAVSRGGVSSPCSLRRRGSGRPPMPIPQPPAGWGVSALRAPGRVSTRLYLWAR